MKKILLICTAILFLTACEDKQKYEEIVLTQMQADQDLTDYKIDPEDMTECVVELSLKDMPGSFGLDPARLTAYQNYTKMLGMNTVEDKKGMIEELRTIFGSPRALADAHRNYAESYMRCMETITGRGEGEVEEQPKLEAEIKPEVVTQTQIISETVIKPETGAEIKSGNE